MDSLANFSGPPLGGVPTVVAGSAPTRIQSDGANVWVIRSGCDDIVKIEPATTPTNPAKRLTVIPFDEQLDADTRDAFHQRMHEEIQQYLAERKPGKQGQKERQRQKQMDAPAPPVPPFPDEPDLAFLYALAGEA